MAARITAVLLDLDGTLLNSIDLIMDAYRHTFEVHADAPADDANLVRGIGTPLKPHFAALGVPDEEIATWIATYATYYRTHAHQVLPYRGATEAVSALGMRPLLWKAMARGAAAESAADCA